jgi:hypothetical protein
MPNPAVLNIVTDPNEGLRLALANAQPQPFERTPRGVHARVTTSQEVEEGVPSFAENTREDPKRRFA